MPCQINQSSFSEVCDKCSQEDKEGIVFLGAGGPLNKWVDGVTEILFKEGIASSKNPEEVWSGFEVLISTAGRHDLVFWLKDENDLNIEKLAMWRLRFGDCLLVSDFVENYADQYN